MIKNRYISNVKMATPPAADSYLASLPAVRCLSSMGQLSFDAPVTFFVGENGTGKSTLLEAIAVSYGFNPEGGTRNFNFSTQDSHSSLYEHIQLGRGDYPKDGYFLRAESFYNLASTSLINIRIVPAISSTAMAEYPCTGSLTGKASSL